MSQFTTEVLDKILKIHCPKNLDAVFAKAFSEQSKAWMLNPVQYFVMDLEGVTAISREFYRVLIQLKSTLKRDQKSIFSVNITPALLKQIKIDGVDLAFNPIDSIDSIVGEKTAGHTGGLNAELVSPFVTATQKTIEVQCKTKVKTLKLYLKTAQVPNIAIASVISLISNEFSGNMVICFPQRVFLTIYENMFGEKHETINSDLEDAAGEILNIIYGLAKIELNPKGYNFQKALPTVLTGEQLKFRQSGSKPAVIIPFETDAGQFHIEFEFNKTVEDGHV